MLTGEYTHLDHDLILHEAGEAFCEPGVVVAQIRQYEMAQFVGRGPINDEVLQRVLRIHVKMHSLVGAALCMCPGHGLLSVADTVEVDMDSKYIGRIEIFDEYSLVDLPEEMLKELFYWEREILSIMWNGNINAKIEKEFINLKVNGPDLYFILMMNI